MNGDVLFQSTENCLTMAAGSDPQPVESSVVPGRSKTVLVPTKSLTRITAVRNHIPYSDHNYGKPLTPPDSCSPEHPEEADTGNEEEGFTRCICGFKHDDGYMICCDQCSAWQHVECVGIKSNSVPDTYLCDVCDPRPLDKERAKQIQAKKREEPTDDEEEDGDVSDHESDNGGVLASLSNPASIKENILTKGKRKKRESTSRKLGQKEIKHNKRKRRKRKHISTDAIPVDEETNGPWDLSPFTCSFGYQEAHKTVYIGDLDVQSFQVSQFQINLPNIIKHEQLCKVVEVQKNKKGVVVTEDTSGEQFIIECKGNLMMESKFKEDHPVLAKCSPFVLYYTKFDHLRLVMNLGTYGNDARFIRRSCSPSAEVRHVTVDNQVHLVVVSIMPLATGSEVTVAFEFPFHEYRHQLECACAQDNCNVQKHNLALQSYEQTNGYSRKDEHGLSLIDSSLSNHMDSDSDGDNSNDVKDKRNRKKLSREERKLQAYLRQIEKMEKTEKKRQQSNGRDSRTGILTQRNFGDDYNCDTPTKPGKGLRKQGLNQRHQCKIQSIVRRTHRLPSCSSEPLSPEDISSTASTPTTPLINVVEEHNEVHTHDDTPEKSFKFPKFKKGSLTDVTSSNGDLTQSSTASPEPAAAIAATIPSKATFDSRLVDVEMNDPALLDCSESLENLEQTINGSTSPARTDPIASPSPCHSTLASPTRSESIDLSDMTYRHCSVSPTTSLASYLLTQKERNSSHLHSTLKKRWLLKYFSECPADRTPNGIVPTNSIKQNEFKTISQRTFPLPYKRRKLMEYVNNQNISTKLDQQTSNNSAAVTVSAVISSVPPIIVTSNMSNSVTSITTSDVRDRLLLSCSQNSSPISRNNVEYDEVSSGRSSLSSISSTEDIKTDFSDTKMESESNCTVDSSTGNSTAPPVSSNTLSSSVQDGELEENCLTQSDEVTTVKDPASYMIGSSVEGHSTVTSGGKKKVTLSEYLNRKRTSSKAFKKEACPPGRSSDVSSPSQSRVVDNAASVPSSSDPVVVNHQLPSTTTSNPVTVNYRLPSSTSSNPVTVNHQLPSSTGSNPVVVNHRLPSSTGSNPVVVNHRSPSTTSGSNPVTVNYRLPSSTGNNPLTVNYHLPSSTGSNPVVMNHRSPSTTTSNPVVMNHRSPSTTSSIPVTVNYRLPSTTATNPVAVNHRLPSTSGSNPVVVNHRLPSNTSSNPVTMNYRSPSTSGNTLATTLSSSVTSSTGGALIEPVSPDDGCSAEDDRPVLNTTTPLQDLRITPVVTEAKPSVVVPDSYFNTSLSRPLRHMVTEPGSSSDAMDIEEDEAPSSSTILVNTPVMCSTGTTSGVVNTLTRPYSPLQQMKINNVLSVAQSSMMNDSLISPESLRQRRPDVVVPSPRIPNPSLHGLSRHQDFNSSSSTRPTSFH